jgi:hypothetical protein
MNNVIKIIPQSPLPADERDRILAEVYGLRAYIYYLMVQTWGNVPLNTEPVETINNAAETYKHRTGADTVMAQVKVILRNLCNCLVRPMSSQVVKEFTE